MFIFKSMKLTAAAVVAVGAMTVFGTTSEAAEVKLTMVIPTFPTLESYRGQCQPLRHAR